MERIFINDFLCTDIVDRNLFLFGANAITLFNLVIETDGVFTY